MKLILATYIVGPLRLRSKNKMTTILLCRLTDIVNIMIPIKDRNGLNCLPNPGASLTNQAGRKEGERGVGREKGLLLVPFKIASREKHKY